MVYKSIRVGRDETYVEPSRATWAVTVPLLVAGVWVCWRWPVLPVIAWATPLMVLLAWGALVRGWGYTSADDHGITNQGVWGRRRFRWEDIVAVEAWPGRYRLVFQKGRPVTLAAPRGWYKTEDMSNLLAHAPHNIPVRRRVPAAVAIPAAFVLLLGWSAVWERPWLDPWWPGQTVFDDLPSVCSVLPRTGAKGSHRYEDDDGDVHDQCTASPSASDLHIDMYATLFQRDQDESGAQRATGSPPDGARPEPGLGGGAYSTIHATSTSSESLYLTVWTGNVTFHLSIDSDRLVDGKPPITRAEMDTRLKAIAQAYLAKLEPLRRR